MSFTDRLLLWLHVAFSVFTLGPVVAAMMATPRYIRRCDLPVLRYLCRTTGIFGLLTVGVFLFGLLLGRNDLNQAWLTASMTLFIVAAALLVLVFRDQRRAINAIAKMLAVGAAAAAAGPATGSTVLTRPGKGPAPPASAPEAAQADQPATATAPGRPDASAPADQPGGLIGEPTTPAEPSPAARTSAGRGSSALVATVERGRIASLGGVITAIWLAILVLMVWNP